MDAVMVLVAKLGTVLVDRRFWVTLLTMGVLLGLLPTTLDTEMKADELVAAALAVVQGVGVLMSAVMLVYSWTKRPPSGKGFAEEKQQAEAVYEALITALKKG